MLTQLVMPDVFGICGVGRSPQESGEVSNVPNIILLCMGAQTSHHHVLLHALV